MSSVSLLISLGLDIAEGVTKRFLFAISLIGTTIQDGGKEERSNMLTRSLTTSLRHLCKVILTSNLKFQNIK